LARVLRWQDLALMDRWTVGVLAFTFAYLGAQALRVGWWELAAWMVMMVLVVWWWRRWQS